MVEFRESERGDAIGRIEIATRTVKPMAVTPWRVKQLEASPDGKYRRIEVKVTSTAAGSAFEVHHRTGYYTRKSQF